MAKPHVTRLLLIAWVAALCACGGGSLPSGTAGHDSRPISAHRHQVSWMLAEAKAEDLLYVSDIYNGVVDVYDYGKARQVGAMFGFDQPTGECVDKLGDVWVTEYYGYQAFEFAHGKRKPIKVLTTNGNAMGCAVDPVTGNLAIGSQDSKQNAWGDIQVFPKGGGSPKTYYSYAGNEGCPYMQAPGYDDKGNLYFEARWGNAGWKMCELPANGSAIVRVRVAKAKYYKTLDHPGSTMWDGKYITFEDYRNNESQNSVMYQAESGGSQLTVVGSTTLGAKCRYANVMQPFVVGTRNTPGNHKQGAVVVGGNEGCYSLFGYWTYPAGGAPFKEKPGPASIGGAAVSLAAP